MEGGDGKWKGFSIRQLDPNWNLPEPNHSQGFEDHSIEPLPIELEW